MSLSIGKLTLKAIPALQDNYIWLLHDSEGNALVVDPSEFEPVQATLAKADLQLRGILITHHHADHTGGLTALARAHPDARVYAPLDERIPGAWERVGEASRVTLSAPAIQFEVWEVPGHTRSHVAYVGQGLLFCGDTLFSLGCGRLFEGTPAQMLAAMDRMAALPADTLVCCAHEYTLANGAFALSVDPDNPRLQARLEEARRARAAGRPSVPSSMATELSTNPFLRTGSSAIANWACQQGTTDADRVTRFAALRLAKDDFTPPATT